MTPQEVANQLAPLLHQEDNAALKLLGSVGALALAVPTTVTTRNIATLSVALVNLSANIDGYIIAVGNFQTALANVRAMIAAPPASTPASPAPTPVSIQNQPVITIPTVTISGKFQTPIATQPIVPEDIAINGVQFVYSNNSWTVIGAPKVTNPGALKVAPSNAYGPAPQGIDRANPPTTPVNVSGNSSGGGTGVHGSGGSGGGSTQPSECSECTDPECTDCGHSDCDHGSSGDCECTDCEC
jgi:hypothetical protein